MTSPVAAVSAPALGATTCAVVLGSLVVTYTLYVLEGVGPAFLPMLSDTFVPIPGNYISRISLNACGIVLFPLAAVPYYSTAQPDEWISRKALAAMAMLGAVCLATVGAVCESDDAPTCMGNETVHTASAITFFACYDVYAVTLTLQGHFKSAERRTKALLYGALAVSLASKVRLLGAEALVGGVAHGGRQLAMGGAAMRHAAADAGAATTDGAAAAADAPQSLGDQSFGDNLLAMFEYADTGAIALWVVAMCRHKGQGMSFGFAPVAQPATDRVAVDSVPVKMLALGTAGGGLATLGLTFAIALAQGTVQPEQQWPYISDLWVQKPSDMISRLAICATGAMIAVCQLGHFAAVQAPRAAKPRLTRLAHGLSMAAGAGLMGVGACNEEETPPLHYTSAALFFGAICLWMPLDLASSVGQWTGPSRALAVIAASACIGAKLGQLWCTFKHGAGHHPYRTHAVDDIGVVSGVFSDVTPQVLEWCAALTGIGYFMLTHVAAPDATFAVYAEGSSRSSKASKLAPLERA